MKIFKVTAEGWVEWEEAYAIVVVAESKEKALKIAKKGNPWRYGMPKLGESDNVYWEFGENQDLEIVEVDLSQEQVLLSDVRNS